MPKYLFSTLAAALVTLGGCATAVEPHLPLQPVSGFDLVDPARVDADQYAKDYAHCATLGNQTLVDLPRTAANALNSAADKVSLGVLGGRAGKNADRVSVLKRCLTGQGYTVLR